MDAYDAIICIGLILAFIFVTKQARDDNDHYISLATYREGDSGMVIKLVDKNTGKIEKKCDNSFL